MDRMPVTSRSLAEVGYDAKTRTLEVLFKSGGLYRYREVPEAIYDGLLQAESLGRFLNLQVKDRYEAIRIEPGGGGWLRSGRRAR